MTKYFFDLELGETLERDTVGTELEAFHAVRDEAVSTLAQIASDYLPSTRSALTIAIVAKTNAGVEVYRAELRFSETSLKVE
jgi:hypothetical protein